MSARKCLGVSKDNKRLCDLLRRVLDSPCYNASDDLTDVETILDQDLADECRRALGEE